MVTQGRITQKVDGVMRVTAFTTIGGETQTEAGKLAPAEASVFAPPIDDAAQMATNTAVVPPAAAPDWRARLPAAKGSKLRPFNEGLTSVGNKGLTLAGVKPKMRLDLDPEAVSDAAVAGALLGTQAEGTGFATDLPIDAQAQLDPQGQGPPGQKPSMKLVFDPVAVSDAAVLGALAGSQGQAGFATDLPIDAQEQLKYVPPANSRVCELTKGPRGFGLRIDPEGKIELHTFKQPAGAPPVGAEIIGVNGAQVSNKDEIMAELMALGQAGNQAPVEFRFIPPEDLGETFVARVDCLCEKVAALEKLLDQDGVIAWTEEHLAAAAADFFPSTEERCSLREQRREARHARLAAARARRQAAAERRDALKLALQEEEAAAAAAPWKLRMFQREAGEKWRVLIHPDYGIAPTPDADPGATPEAQELSVQQKEHAASHSERIHEEEALRMAMVAERNANAKERLAIEIGECFDCASCPPLPTFLFAPPHSFPLSSPSPSPPTSPLSMLHQPVCLSRIDGAN